MYSTKTISRILLISVLEEETLPFVNLLELKPMETKNPFFTLYLGSFFTLSLHLIQPKKDPKFLVDSIGPEIASLVAYIGIQNYNPDIVISFGTAGAVIKDNQNARALEIGDVCVSEDGSIFYDRDCNLNNGFADYMIGRYDVWDLGKDCIKKLGLKVVKIGSSSSFSPDQSNAFRKGVDVCDMECAGISKICFWMGVPFLAVKVISDVDTVSETEQKSDFEGNLPIVCQRLALKLKEILAFLCEKY